MEEYNRRLLQVAAAQLCQQLGWQGIQATAMEMLNDILERYLLSLGRTLHAYSEQFGRTYPEISDLELTFQDLGINLSELGDYLNQVDHVPFAHKLPAVPQARPPDLHFPKPNSRELAEREEHVYDYLPPMHPEWEEELLTPLRGPEAIPVSEDGAPMLMSPTATGDKRPMAQSSDLTPPSKRPRLLPDEAGHSMYEMKSVVMSNGGQPTPTRGQGRLPEACTPPPSTPLTPLPTLPLTSQVKPPLLGSPPSGVIVETVEERTVLEDLDALEEFKPKIEGVDGGPYLHSPPKHMAPPMPAKPSPRPGKKSRAKTPKGKSAAAKSPKGTKSPAPGKNPKSEVSAASPLPSVNPLGLQLPPPSPAARQIGERLGLDMADTESPEPKLVIAEDEARLREAEEQRQARLRSYEDTIDEVIANVCSPSDRLAKDEEDQTRESQMAIVGRSAKERPVERPTVTAFLKKAAEIKAELEEDEETREKRRQMEIQQELEKIRQKTKEYERLERERLEREARIEDTIDDVIRKVTQDTGGRESGDEAALSDVDAAVKPEPAVKEVVEETVVEEPAALVNPPTPRPDIPTEQPPHVSPAMSFSPPATPGMAEPKDIYEFDDDDVEFSVDIPEVPDSPPSTTGMDEMRVRTKASYKMKALEMPPLDITERKLKTKAASPAERSGTYDFPYSYKSPSGSPSTVTTDSPIPPLSLKVDKSGKYLRVSKDDREHKKEKKKKKNKDKDKDRDKKDKDKKDKDRDKKDRKDKDRKKEKDKKKDEKKKDEPTVPKLTFKFGLSDMSGGSPGLSVSIPGDSEPEPPSKETKPPSKVSPKPVEDVKPVPPPVVKPTQPPPKPPAALRPMTPSPPSSPSPQASPTHPPARLPTPPPPSSIPPPPPSSGRGRKGSKAKASPQKPSPPKPPPTKAALKAPPPPKAPKGRPSKKSPKAAAPVPEPKVEEPAAAKHTADAKEASQLRTVVAETVGTIVGENGETIWICPVCKIQDDGSPMIGCDDCDDWYHWECVGINEDPQEDEWFCPRCNAKRIENVKKAGKGPRRKRKKKT